MERVDRIDAEERSERGSFVIQCEKKKDPCPCVGLGLIERIGFVPMEGRIAPRCEVRSAKDRFVAGDDSRLREQAC